MAMSVRSGKVLFLFLFHSSYPFNSVPVYHVLPSDHHSFPLTSSVRESEPRNGVTINLYVFASELVQNDQRNERVTSIANPTVNHLIGGVVVS